MADDRQEDQAPRTSRTDETENVSRGEVSKLKKPFVKPELVRHEKLPEVTCGFFVTFRP